MQILLHVLLALLLLAPLWFGSAFLDNFRQVQADTNSLRTLHNSVLISFIAVR